METKKIVGILAVLAVGYVVYSKMNESSGNDNQNSNEKLYKLPSGRIVKESELTQNGYTRTPRGWVDTNTFLDIQNRLKRGEMWTTILNQLASINWSALTDVNGNRLDINEPFSTTPTDWGLDDWGNLAGMPVAKSIHNEFLY